MENFVIYVVTLLVLTLDILTCIWAAKRWGVDNDPTGYSGMSLGPVFVFFPLFLTYFILATLYGIVMSTKEARTLRREMKLLIYKYYRDLDNEFDIGDKINSAKRLLKGET